MSLHRILTILDFRSHKMLSLLISCLIGIFCAIPVAAQRFYSLDRTTDSLVSITRNGQVQVIGSVGRGINDADLAMLNGKLFALNNITGNRTELIELNRSTGQAISVVGVTYNGMATHNAEGLTVFNGNLYVSFDNRTAGDISSSIAQLLLSGTLSNDFNYGQLLSSVDLDGLAATSQGLFGVNIRLGNDVRFYSIGITPRNISQTGLFLSPAPTRETNDIDFVGSELFGVTNNSSELLRISPVDGSLLESISLSRTGRYVGLVTIPVTVSGAIFLQSISNSVQQIDFTFRPAIGLAFTRTVTLDASGGYSFSDIPAGQYTVSVKGAKWLRKNITVDARAGSVTNAIATLLAGDANNDNFADIADLLLLIAAYNKVSPASGYSEAADFNCDDANDIADLLLLIANYNRQGDV